MKKIVPYARRDKNNAIEFVIARTIQAPLVIPPTFGKRLTTSEFWDTLNLCPPVSCQLEWRRCARLEHWRKNKTYCTYGCSTLTKTCVNKENPTLRTVFCLCRPGENDACKVWGRFKLEARINSKSRNPIYFSLRIVISAARFSTWIEEWQPPEREKKKEPPLHTHILLRYSVSRCIWNSENHGNKFEANGSNTCD